MFSVGAKDFLNRRSGVRLTPGLPAFSGASRLRIGVHTRGPIQHEGLLDNGEGRNCLSALLQCQEGSEHDSSHCRRLLTERWKLLYSVVIGEKQLTDIAVPARMTSLPMYTLKSLPLLCRNAAMH